MRRYGGFLLFILSVVFLICSYYLYAVRLDRVKQPQKEEQNQLLKSDVESLKIKLSQLQAENKIKTEAINALQKTLIEREQKQHRLQTEVNFLESLLAGTNAKKGLRVFKVNAEQKQELTILNMVLAQKITKVKEKTGTIDLKLKGIVGEKSKTLNLTKNFSLNRQFSFKYFQMLKFSIKLPKNFKPTVLMVDLYSKDHKPKNVSQRFNWHDISQKTEEQTDV